MPSGGIVYWERAPRLAQRLQAVKRGLLAKREARNVPLILCLVAGTGLEPVTP